MQHEKIATCKFSEQARDSQAAWQDSMSRINFSLYFPMPTWACHHPRSLDWWLLLPGRACFLPQPCIRPRPLSPHCRSSASQGDTASDRALEMCWIVRPLSPLRYRDTCVIAVNVPSPSIRWVPIFPSQIANARLEVNVYTFVNFETSEKNHQTGPVILIHQSFINTKIISVISLFSFLNIFNPESSFSQMIRWFFNVLPRAHRKFQILPLDTRFRIADKSAFKGDGVTVVGLSYHRSFGKGRFNTVFRYGCLIAYVRHKRSTYRELFIHLLARLLKPFAAID